MRRFVLFIVFFAACIAVRGQGGVNFEILTYVPIDLDAILPEKMSTEEKEMLNHYHKQVYEKVSPYLSEEERIWLKEYTRAVK